MLLIQPWDAQDAPEGAPQVRHQPEEDLDAATLQPVFRAAPYRAEMLRRGQQSTSLKILFLEEGNACRWGNSLRPVCLTSLCCPMSARVWQGHERLMH